jgi:hypothetical protein
MGTRLRRTVLIAAALLALAGCRVSRDIRDLDPVTHPPLTELERHLTYTDPDDGRSNYILTR